LKERDWVERMEGENRVVGAVGVKDGVKVDG